MATVMAQRSWALQRCGGLESGRRLGGHLARLGLIGPHVLKRRVDTGDYG
jgi:hypothetical protein